MTRFKAIASVLVLPLAVVGLFFLSVGEAQAGNVSRNVWSVKFMCGFYEGGLTITLPDGRETVREGPVKIGNYQTAINVHNPMVRPTFIRKKAVMLFNSRQSHVPVEGDFEVPRPPGEFRALVLRPNWGVEIDCDDIRFLLLGMTPGDVTARRPFIKGWVVLETFVSTTRSPMLDVTAAYTSHAVSKIDPGPDGVTGTMDDVLVPEGFSIHVEPIVPLLAGPR